MQVMHIRHNAGNHSSSTASHMHQPLLLEKVHGYVSRGSVSGRGKMHIQVRDTQMYVYRRRHEGGLLLMGNKKSIDGYP